MKRFALGVRGLATGLMGLAAVACAQNVTLTGKLQGANGLPARNQVISLTPTQTMFVPGTNSTQQVGNLVGNTAPSGACAIANQFYTYVPGQLLYQCQYGLWVQVGPIPGVSSDGNNGIIVQGAVAAKRLGPVFEADQYSGSDFAQKINNAVLDAIAHNGGTVDARMFTGTQTASTQISLGTSASEANYIGVALIMPASSTWLFNISDGSSCGIKQWGSTSLLSDGSASLANRTVLNTANSSVDMDSLYCTSYNVADTSAYFRAENFVVSDSVGGGMLRNGAFHVPVAYDGSQWTNVSALTTNGNDSMFVESGCCHIHMDGISVASNGTANPLRLGGGALVNNVALTASSCTITSSSANFTPAYVGWGVDFYGGTGTLAPSTAVTGWTNRTTVTVSPCPTGSGTATLYIHPSITGAIKRMTINGLTVNGHISGGYGVQINGQSSSVTINNGYGEDQHNTNDPYIYIGPLVDTTHIFDFDSEDNAVTTKYAVENHSASSLFEVIRTSAGINDIYNNKIIPPDAGTIPYSMVTSYASSRAIKYWGGQFAFDNGSYNFGIQAVSSTLHGLFLDSAGGIFWGSTGSGTTGPLDTYLYRGAASRLNIGTVNATTSHNGALWLQLLNLNTQVYSQLPTCPSATAPDGTYQAITDATSQTNGAVAAGGGSYHVPVYCNGTNWVVK